MPRLNPEARGAVAREMRRRISFIAKWFFPSQSRTK
jgi:hypothetical protein